MEFIDLLVQRRSIRDFLETEVPLATIREIIREACMAPSSGNGQPWKYIIVNNRERIKKFSDESKGNFLAMLAQNPDSPLKKYEAALRNPDFNVFYNAPALVYIGCSKGVKSAQVDCALAASYFMFSAAAMNLGTCWIALGADIRDPALRKTMAMDDDYQVIAPVILGYPRAVPATPVRNEPQILKVVS